MIGETISHYRIIEILGEGAMGTVYLAEDINLGRRVAIKFLTSITPDYRARFLREARAVSVLTHPNIATVFDYGETDEGKPYLVMELLKGQPLNEKLATGALPLAEAVRIVSSIAAALGEAHHQEIVHRDIKPSNVVITERGHVKVLDFGLVKHIREEQGLDEDSRSTLTGARTRSDVIVGTPLYLSPEQATGKKVDGRSDLFALGAVLYECITGQSAFSGSSVIEIGAQVIYSNPPPPSKLYPVIPPELDRITLKALEKKPEARYQNADELIADLQALLPILQSESLHVETRGTKPIVAPRTLSASALTTLTETFRRPRLSLGAFVLTIIAVIGIGWLILRWWQPGPYQPSTVASEWYVKGTDALRQGAFLQASRAFEQAIANDPNFPLAHARLAESSFELDNADRAKDEMLKVQALVPNRSQLASTDSLHLEAINATVTKDFPGAINAYLELVKHSPDDAHVYVDLGRAYEKNDDLNEAIESFQQATNRDPNYPTAFLRLGILYGRQINIPGALSAFDKADTLYQALGSFEGQAEVAYQRGFLFDQLSKVPEARQSLERALDLSRTTGNEYMQVKTLLKLGYVELELNKNDEARKYMRQGIELAAAKGIDNLTKRGLVDMGNTYLSDGNYPEAENYFKRSLEFSNRTKDPRNAARALLSLGSLAERQAKTDESLDYIEQALPFYKQGGYRKETMQAFALLARVKTQQGDYDAAHAAFAELLEVMKQLGDQSQAGTTHHDIGLLFIKQGKYPEALEQFHEAYRIAQSNGIPKHLVLSLIDRANALWHVGRYDEAKTALREASSTAERKETAPHLSASFYLARARVALSERSFDEARLESLKALERAGIQLKNTTAGAATTLCLAHALSGSAQQAKQACDQAIAKAHESTERMIIAEAQLARSQAMLLIGDNAAAVSEALAAQEFFARSGRQDYEWHALLIAARASRAANDAQKTRDYAARANSTLSGLQLKWGQDYYNTYLSRPDVQFSRKQLSELLAEFP